MATVLEGTRVRLEPVRVMTGSADEDGRLMFVDEQLCALFVRLDAELHQDVRDGPTWSVETAYGLPGIERHAPLFNDPEAAAEWIVTR